MSFGSPILLVSLVAVPIAVLALVWLERRRSRQAAVWAAPALLPNIASEPPRWRRWLPVSVLLLGVALLLVGFARPRAGLTVGRNEATLVVVMDISGSMAANDAQPSRLAVAKRDVLDLLAKTPAQYRVAIVAFSDHSAVVAPPTRDRTVITGALERLHSGPEGTALTDGLLRALLLGHSLPKIDGKRPPASVLVLSDGASNSGRVTQQQVIAAAKKDATPISAVVIGTASGVVQQKLQGGFTEQIAVPVAPQLLEAVAKGSGGRAYTGSSTLTTVVHELGTRTGQEHKTVEVTVAATAGGLACMLIGGLLSGMWFRRIP